MCVAENPFSWRVTGSGGGGKDAWDVFKAHRFSWCVTGRGGGGKGGRVARGGVNLVEMDDGLVEVLRTTTSQNCAAVPRWARI